MEGTHKWHGKAPNEELALKALAQLEETLGDFPQKASSTPLFSSNSSTQLPKDK
jgi:hypothetical protein